MKSSYSPLAFAILAPAVLLLAVASMPPVTADTGTAPLAPVDKKALFSERCSACHNLPDPTTLSYTRAEWQRTVNLMLTKYKASDEITPTEASEIVDYLATFAPKPNANPGNRAAHQWDPEEEDVWFSTPTHTFVDNFEDAGGISHMIREAAGTPTRPVWKLAKDGTTPDSTVAKVVNAGADPGSFALLVDPRTKSSDVDVKVRFKIVDGVSSPAVGVAVGLQDSSHYDVVRYNRKTNDLALIEVAEPAHATLQDTPVVIDAQADPASTVSFDSNLGQWHTLRVQVRQGHLRGWVDSYKRISVNLTDYDGGQVGLWSQGDTVAEFDDWTTDVYDTVPAPVVPTS